MVLPRDTVKDAIDKLLEEQKKVRAERKRVSADQKNAQRKQKRLNHRASLLSSGDLLLVMALRTQEEEAKAQKAVEVTP